jgi:hypothetical protein
MIVADGNGQEGSFPIGELHPFTRLHPQYLDDMTGIILVQGEFLLILAI